MYPRFTDVVPWNHHQACELTIRHRLRRLILLLIGFYEAF